MSQISDPASQDTKQTLEPTGDSARILLSNHPFQNRLADPDTLYINTDHSQLFAQLSHYLENTRFILMVSGQTGSGKTALLHQYMVRLPEGYKSLTLDAGSGLTGVELLSKLADYFNVSPRQATPGGSAYLQMFKDLNPEDGQPLLVLDNAHLLDDRTLQLVTKLSEHGLRLILFTDPVLEQRLCKLQLSWCNDNTQVLRVQPLDEQQVLCYLRQRFELAGYTGPMPFSDEEVDNIRRESGGLPGNINRMARQILESRPLVVPKTTSTYVPHSDPHGAGRATIAAGLAVSILAAIALVFLLKDRINLTSTSADTELAKTWSTSMTTATSPTDGLPNSKPNSQDKPAVPSPQDSHIRVAAGQSTEFHSAEKETLTADPHLTNVTPPGTEDTALLSRPSTPAVRPATALSDTRSSLPEFENISAEPTVSVADITDKNRTPAQTEADPSHTTLDKASKQNKDPEPVSPKVDPSVASTKVNPEPKDGTAAPVTKKPETIIEDKANNLEHSKTPGTPGKTQDILERNSRHYTMQLIAGHQKSAVLRLADKFDIQDKSAWYEITRKGRPWYALVYEDYPSRQAALDGLGALPQGLKKRKPWIRRFSAIQKSIRESGPAKP